MKVRTRHVLAAIAGAIVGTIIYKIMEWQGWTGVG